MGERYIWYMTPLNSDNVWLEMIAYRFIPKEEIDRMLEAEKKSGINYIFNNAKKFYTATISPTMERKIATIDTFSNIYDAHNHEWTITKSDLQEPVYTTQPHFDFLSVLEDCLAAFKRQKIEISKVLFKLDKEKLHLEQVIIESEYNDSKKIISVQIGWK